MDNSRHKVVKLLNSGKQPKKKTIETECLCFMPSE